MYVCISVYVSIYMFADICVYVCMYRYLNFMLEHGAVGRRIDPSWGGPIELFLVPASAPRLV